MDIIDRKTDLLPVLQSFETFQKIETTALEWLIEKGHYKRYKKGEFLFYAGMKTEHMQVIIQGNYSIWLDQNGERLEMGEFGVGNITGVLPFSRMKTARGNGQATETTEVLELHKDYFIEMVNVSYELTQALVGYMSSRIRDFTQLRSQNEKLASLGKLSAGLAHELNNPASAIVRSAKELYQNIHSTPEKFKAVITMRITSEQTDLVNAILFKRLKNPAHDLSILDRQDAFDELLDWLDDHEVEEGDDLAETFVDFGINPEDLDTINDILKGQHLPIILSWIESTLALERLVMEIQESADRIAELVGSVKQYSHMDRGSAMELTDIRDGIVNTLIILKHKAKYKNIQVNKEFDTNLPSFKAFVGELNQVWTNLIANAIDALDKGGLLTIRTYAEDPYICVEIQDNGAGIPTDVMEHIFDPFFTTKSISEGTGMGLDITKKIIDRHRGTITVKSEPGNTIFKVCLPIKASS